MKSQEALDLVATLNEACKAEGLTFKVTHPTLSSKATDYSVKPIRMVERINLMSGKPYMEEDDTPSYCSPAYEAYWQM